MSRFNFVWVYSPVYRVDDINANRNVAGGGINLAQRVMDCGDGGHILVSKPVADMLLQLAHWKAAIHDLAEHEVKHGVKIHIFNLFDEEFGNSSLPTKLNSQRPPVLQRALERAGCHRPSNGTVYK